VISATATDEDGIFSANAFPVQITNVAKTTVAISGPASIEVGAVYTLNLSVQTTAGQAINHWNISWGDGHLDQVVIGNPTSVTHTYPSVGHFVIAASASDNTAPFKAGNSVAVNVTHQAPTVTIGGPASVFQAAPYTLNLAATTPSGHPITHW